MQKDTYYEIYRIHDNGSLVSYTRYNSLEEGRTNKIALEKHYNQFKFVLCKIVREVIE